jgi:hypothetical protein
MNEEDIIRMAREAGMAGMLTDVVTTFDELARFAALVAAAATEAANARANTSWTLMCKKMVAAENEACAKVAEEWLGPTKDRELHIAAAIRAREQA